MIGIIFQKRKCTKRKRVMSAEDQDNNELNVIQSTPNQRVVDSDIEELTGELIQSTPVSEGI